MRSSTPTSSPRWAATASSSHPGWPHDSFAQARSRALPRPARRPLVGARTRRGGLPCPPGFNYLPGG
jgi:hypothetical protein